MKIKTSELIDITLDWAVSYALGHNPMKDFHSHGMTWRGWWETTSYIDTKPNEYRRIPRYSINWEYGGPIIERELISVETNFIAAGYEHPHGAWHWRASCVTEDDKAFWLDGPTPLIAAMRCYVASKLGDVVEIPEELQ